MTKWWEKEPIRFECQADCFKCCIKPGIVNFDREDIRNAADFLKISPAEFKKTFLTRDEGYWVIEVGEEGAPCSFLTDQGCGIHPAKPKQCQSYPFWRENMDSKPIVETGRRVLPRHRYRTHGPLGNNKILPQKISALVPRLGPLSRGGK